MSVRTCKKAVLRGRIAMFLRGHDPQKKKAVWPYVTTPERRLYESLDTLHIKINIQTLINSWYTNLLTICSQPQYFPNFAWPNPILRRRVIASNITPLFAHDAYAPFHTGILPARVQAIHMHMGNPYAYGQPVRLLAAYMCMGHLYAYGLPICVQVGPYAYGPKLLLRPYAYECPYAYRYVGPCTYSYSYDVGVAIVDFYWLYK